MRGRSEAGNGGAMARREGIRSHSESRSMRAING